MWLPLEKFGAPRRNLKCEDFATPNTVYQIGVPPQRIDILTTIDGVEFDEAWNGRKQVVIEGLSVGFLGRELLIKNKRATGRPMDLADVAWLEDTSE